MYVQVTVFWKPQSWKYLMWEDNGFDPNTDIISNQGAAIWMPAPCTYPTEMQCQVSNLNLKLVGHLRYNFGIIEAWIKALRWLQINVTDYAAKKYNLILKQLYFLSSCIQNCTKSTSPRTSSQCYIPVPLDSPRSNIIFLPHWTAQEQVNTIPPVTLEESNY